MGRGGSAFGFAFSTDGEGICFDSMDGVGDCFVTAGNCVDLGADGSSFFGRVVKDGSALLGCASNDTSLGMEAELVLSFLCCTPSGFLEGCLNGASLLPDTLLPDVEFKG